MTEDYFLYFEEIDWARRGRPSFRLGYAPDSLVLHAVGAAIGTDDFGSPSPLSQYYLARNRVKFLARFSPLSLPLAVLDMLKNSWREHRKGSRAGAKAMVQGVIGRRFVRTDAG
jgi:GT2 family glycosyltransferase